MQFSPHQRPLGQRMPRPTPRTSAQVGGTAARSPFRGQQSAKKNRSLPKAPTDKLKSKRPNKYFVAGDDGKLQPVTPEGGAAGRAMVTHFELENAMAAGAADNIDANSAIFVDNCADQSFANSFDGKTSH